MKKITLPFCALALSLAAISCGDSKKISNSGANAAANGNAQEIEVSDEISVSEAEVSAALEYLSSDELEGRKTGTQGIEDAAIFIEEVFEDNNIKPYFNGSYRDSFEIDGLDGYNLVGLKEGSDPDLKDEFIIVGAHYDHIGFGKKVGVDSLANGANDNATGTTAVLELAKYFSDKDTKRSILFTLFSAEEMGLVGAKRLSERFKEENLDLYVMFNIEMIGIPMEGRDYEAYLTGYDLSNLAEKFNEYSGEKVLGFLPQAKEYNLFRRSDNYPFYEDFQVPAQTISTFDFTNYDYYHHVSDEFQYMDVSHMANLIEAVIPGISATANSETREIKMKDE